MGFALIIIGLVLVLSAVRNETDELNAILADDFLGRGGQGSYFTWVVAMLLIGAIGVYKPLRPVSDGFLALVIVVLLIGNEGFFSKFEQQALE